jgi:xanthine/uracil/vitamin C permease (AzgA family)
MDEAKPTLKQRGFHGMRRGLVIASYLFVVLSLLDIHKSVILADYQVDLMEFGLNFINALALAKVILVGQELDFANQLRDAPLIYPTLLKSFAYTVLLACFKITEVAIVGMFHHRSFVESVAGFAGGSWTGLLSLMVLLFVVLIPFFGFGELRRVFGEDIVRVFLRPRHLLNRPPIES